MVLDSIPPASKSKDMIKKKRSKKTAKLKQSKLDARRKQWVSQVNNHGAKVDGNGVHVQNGREQAIGVLKINGENDGWVHNYSDSDWCSNSRIERVAGSNCSGSNFSGSSGSRSSPSCTSYSGNLSDKEEDGGLDNWEALADALAATGDKQEQQLKSPAVTQLDPVPKAVKQPGASSVDVSRQAGRGNDAFRPHCPPNLVRRNSVPVKPDRIYAHGGPVWVRENVVWAPTPCPVCCEDLDMTDSSFLPCSCGFQLCLFCHKRIVEEDGRCPGCRKPYESHAVQGGGISDFSSCSMITRS